VNLALALAADGARVGLFDADLYGPNVPLMLGVRRSKPASGMVSIARRDPEPYIEPLERHGLKVMSVGFLLGEQEAVLTDPRAAGDIIRQTMQDVLWGDLDYLLVDLPPGTGEPQQTLLRGVHLDAAIIVTTPQDLARLDAGRSLELFSRRGIPLLGVIENMAYLVCPHCGERIEVFERSDREWALEDEAITVLGSIPIEPALGRASASGGASPVFAEIARAVARGVGELD
jgi:ATP-binding protein involved in chromosome partitioning